MPSERERTHAASLCIQSMQKPSAEFCQEGADKPFFTPPSSLASAHRNLTPE